MFEGFRPETIDFLWGIRLNNNRDWFMEHKKEYTDYVYEPLKQLAFQTYGPWERLPGMCCKVTRIYRDARVPHKTGPYKESLWFSFRRDVQDWARHSGVFFSIAADGYSYGFGIPQPWAASMTLLRQRLTERPEPFLALVDKLEADTGLVLGGEEYKRKKPCGDPRIAGYYNLKNLMAYREKPVDDALFSPALADEVGSTLEALIPLNEYFQALFG